jgi:hypothetical protein
VTDAGRLSGKTTMQVTVNPDTNPSLVDIYVAGNENWSRRILEKTGKRLHSITNIILEPPLPLLAAMFAWQDRYTDYFNYEYAAKYWKKWSRNITRKLR